jgi:CheR methyltransferase, SAM binding domain
VYRSGITLDGRASRDYWAPAFSWRTRSRPIKASDGYARPTANTPRVQLFATDIDERALAVARAARYPEVLLDSVSPERRKRFFLLDGGSYVLSKDVRELCIFSPHRVIRVSISSRAPTC